VHQLTVERQLFHRIHCNFVFFVTKATLCQY
jgi:hypothetical protein